MRNEKNDFGKEFSEFLSGHAKNKKDCNSNTKTSAETAEALLRILRNQFGYKNKEE